MERVFRTEAGESAPKVSSARIVRRDEVGCRAFPDSSGSVRSGHTAGKNALRGKAERGFDVAKYQKLLEPFSIGNVELRNRFVMLPMTI